VIGSQVAGYFVTVSLAQAQSQSTGIRESELPVKRARRLCPMSDFQGAGFSRHRRQKLFVFFVRSDTPKHIIDKLRSVFATS